MQGACPGRRLQESPSSLWLYCFICPKTGSFQGAFESGEQKKRAAVAISELYEAAALLPNFHRTGTSGRAERCVEWERYLCETPRWCKSSFSYGWHFFSISPVHKVSNYTLYVGKNSERCFHLGLAHYWLLEVNWIQGLHSAFWRIILEWYLLENSRFISLSINTRLFICLVKIVA